VTLASPLALASAPLAADASPARSPAAPFPPSSEAPPASGPALKKRHLPDTPSDRDLVERAQSTGDRRAFGELTRRHQRRIFRLTFHMLRDAAEAEDVTQETFLRAYGAIARFDGRSEPYTWLYRIAVNLSLNAIRARRARRANGGGEEDSPSATPPTGTVSPVDAAHRQLYATIALAIDALSESLRTTLILVCIDGLSHEAAAEVLGAPEGTIAWRVHEARRRLKETLASRGFDLVEALRDLGATR
jgi:RNA polymerase sigma-70 factor (ECF subfamily)